MAKKRYHYSKPKQKQDNQNVDWNKTFQDEIPHIEIEKPFRFEDKRADKVFEDWEKRFTDDWVNNIASINANNSLTQYSEFILNRLSYAECSHLSTDTIIHNAITKFTNEMLREGGFIELDDTSIENSEEVIDKLEKRMKETKFFDRLKQAIEVSLEYGNALFFIDADSKDLSKPLYESINVMETNPVRGFKVVAPYGTGAVDVETANMLSQDYMIPKKWYVQGGGVVDASRFENLIIFKAPELIKPMYNFGGISMCQFMREYVKTANSSRMTLAESMIRFKTDVVKSPEVRQNPKLIQDRAKAMNRQKNNYGTLLLRDDEDYQQTTTSITGLDKLSAHQMEYVAVSARMPSVKLFGLTPSGFNATGDFDLQSYYDEMMSIQNADIKPVIERMLRLFSLEMGLDIYPTYTFNELNKKDELKSAQIQQIHFTNALNAVSGGLMTHEQAIEYLQKEEVLDDSFQFDESALENEDYQMIEQEEEQGLGLINNP